VLTNILAKYPQADLRVYAVWLPVLRTDARWTWRSDRLDDWRVTQFWDSEDEIGRWFMKNVTHRVRAEKKIEWDAYFLYAAGAKWASVPEPLTSWGRPVLETGGELRQNLLPLLSPIPGGAP
jgi:hypothetical protein